MIIRIILLPKVEKIDGISKFDKNKSSHNTCIYEDNSNKIIKNKDFESKFKELIIGLEKLVVNKNESKKVDRIYIQNLIDKSKKKTI